MKIKENSFFAKVAAKKLKTAKVAITIGQTIYLHNTSKDEFLSDICWVRHEKQHLRQFRKYGLLRFIVMYTWESMRKGYYNNKWEVEARAAENKDGNENKP
ncbi:MULTISPECIES: DUF4157 domain-containing protein [Chitinophagaceae]